MRRWVVLAFLALGGCGDIGSATRSIVTAGVAATVGTATGSPLFGIIAGVAASLAVDEGGKYVERRVHENVQDAVAQAAGPLDNGESAIWSVDEALPLSRRFGTVQVVRGFGTAIPCKDIVFTVEDEPDFYIATVCRNRNGIWRWAVAEPTIRRWDGLQ